MKQIVTIGGDDFTAWIRTADGTKYNLGTVSILQLVTKLCADSKQVRSILDDVVSGQEAMLVVDSDRLWKLLMPRKRVLSSDSFIPFPKGRAPMPLSDTLVKLDQHITALNKAASKGVNPVKMQEGLKILANLVQRVSPDVSVSAESILDQAEAAFATVARLESEGRQFQASKARKDIYDVTSQLAEGADPLAYNSLSKRVAAISRALVDRV